MDDDASERLFYLGIGPLAAIALGMVLVPLRDVTTASNFTFLFLALTIVVAELGGRWPAVATALASALSLDFFLTQPYARLAIEDKNDIIAFVGLGACGLLAAALASERGRASARLANAQRHLALLRSGVDQLAQNGDLGRTIGEILNACQDAVPLAGAVVRNAHEQVLAAVPPSHSLLPVPALVLAQETLLALSDAGPDLSRRSLALPAEGGRIPLRIGKRSLGWLDVWGNGSPASTESRRALADGARLIALSLASTTPAERD